MKPFLIGALLVASAGCATRVHISPYGYRLDAKLPSTGVIQGRYSEASDPPSTDLFLAVYFYANTDLVELASHKKVDRLRFGLGACSSRERGAEFSGGSVFEVGSAEHKDVFGGDQMIMAHLYKVLLRTDFRQPVYYVGISQDLEAAQRDGLCIRVAGGRWPFPGGIDSNLAPIAARLVGDVTFRDYRPVGAVKVCPNWVQCDE